VTAAAGADHDIPSQADTRPNRRTSPSRRTEVSTALTSGECRSAG
jgi:hypothetical protein